MCINVPMPRKGLIQTALKSPGIKTLIQLATVGVKFLIIIILNILMIFPEVHINEVQCKFFFKIYLMLMMSQLALSPIVMLRFVPMSRFVPLMTNGVPPDLGPLFGITDGKPSLGCYERRREEGSRHYSRTSDNRHSE